LTKKRIVPENEKKLPKLPVGGIGSLIPSIAAFNESVRILKEAERQEDMDEDSTSCRSKKPTRVTPFDPFD